MKLLINFFIMNVVAKSVNQVNKMKILLGEDNGKDL